MILLASQSPRRHELLALAGIPHKIFVPDADEGTVPYVPGHPEEFVRAAACLKNRAAQDALLSGSAGGEKVNFANVPFSPEEARDAVILSADTVVYDEEGQRIFGKPGGAERAAAMLRALSGRVHRVITGVALCDLRSGEEVCFAESTEVHFRKLEADEIEEYLRVWRPFDKAGAYGIQDGACVFVEKIVGDYYNVVGLPLCRVSVELRKLQKLRAMN
ncbi:MAG: Maf family protein [Eubacteriales bacterium]